MIDFELEPQLDEPRQRVERFVPEVAIPAEPLTAYLDQLGLGAGEPRIEPIGDGHSNLTFLVEREGARMVLRRPPRGPLPPSAHDVVREARLLSALRPQGVPVPEVLATCAGDTVIGAPFYLMAWVDGYVLTDEMPAPLAGEAGRVAECLVDGLIELHAVDPSVDDLAGFGRADGYLERQLKRFGGLYEVNATRPLPDLEAVADWLAVNLPDSAPSTVVHGDYRLGNVMLAPSPTRLAAILDWEMATIGDPLADLGYLTAMWSEPTDPPNPVSDLSALTRGAGFPGRDFLTRRYAEGTGHSMNALPWYQVLALWKAAIFLEGSFRRYGAGTTADPYFAGLETGVPALAALARARTAAA
ncbi:MAG TPA: phosphotransferase family protein [Solirubrobacterales bacterium]|nr:phosphotransferase family protein [Solirubrobacterales bacterium]